MADTQLLSQAQRDLGFGRRPRVDRRREHGAPIRVTSTGGFVMWVRGSRSAQVMVKQSIDDRKPGAAPGDHKNEPQ